MSLTMTDFSTLNREGDVVSYDVASIIVPYVTHVNVLIANIIVVINQ